MLYKDEELEDRPPLESNFGDGFDSEGKLYAPSNA